MQNETSEKSFNVLFFVIFFRNSTNFSNSKLSDPDSKPRSVDWNQDLADTPDCRGSESRHFFNIFGQQVCYLEGDPNLDSDCSKFSYQHSHMKALHEMIQSSSKPVDHPLAEVNLTNPLKDDGPDQDAPEPGSDFELVPLSVFDHFQGNICGQGEVFDGFGCSQGLMLKMVNSKERGKIEEDHTIER
jgi:hypothetical protein